MGARWLLALRDLVPMVRQRRLLDRELAETAGSPS
jgi:hypothetical protein